MPETIELEGTQNLAILLVVVLLGAGLLFGYLFYRLTVRPCAANPAGLLPPVKPKLT